MGRIVIFAVILFVSGCTDFKIHIKDEVKKLKPLVILIGSFELRNLDYDPYISEELKDALKFELFKRGYKPVKVKCDGFDNINESQVAVKLCADNRGDILIKGVISQRERGYLDDREVSTLFTFTVYGKDGEIIAEGFYYNNSSACDEDFRRKAAGKVIDELISNFNKDE